MPYLGVYEGPPANPQPVNALALRDMPGGRGQGGKLLALEDESPDGVPNHATARFKLPVAAERVAADWYLLASARDAGDPCDTVTGEVRIVDPSTGAVHPIAMLEFCEPLAPDSSHEAYPRGSGWRVSYSEDLSSLAGKELELRAEVNPHMGASRPKRAALLVDHLRFTSAPGIPSLTSVEPSSGTLCGGTRIVVRGTNLTAGDTSVTVGGKSLGNVRWIDALTITGETPPGAAAGSVAVSASNPMGTATLSGAFTYGSESCGVKLRRGDCNNEGKVDMSDAVYLLDYLFRGGAAPTAPFPACGADLTSDTLACTTPSCP